MSVKDLIAPFSVWKRAFEKPYTTRNPIDERPGAPRYRGFHTKRREPLHWLRHLRNGVPERGNRPGASVTHDTRHGDSGLRPMVDYGRCCWCALCVDVCPTGSLGMSNEYIWVDTDPDVFRYVPGENAKEWDDSELGYERADGYELMEKKRVDMEMLSPEEGLSSFRELVQGYSEEQAKKEADRCLACGICVATCPAHMDVPGYIRAIRDDDLHDGLRIVYESNPLPASCGRVCTHTCESVCAKRHGEGEAISIRWLKRYIADQIYAQDYEQVLGSAEEPNGKRVAIVGSGPGGMSAAYYLRLLGYEVTVFDSRDLPGGMLRYGIPEYRLPYDQINKDIEYIRSLGVEIKQEFQIGRDLSFEDIYTDYEAVFISTGLPDPYQMGIPGENIPAFSPASRFSTTSPQVVTRDWGRGLRSSAGETSPWTPLGRRAEWVSMLPSSTAGAWKTCPPTKRRSMKPSRKGCVLFLRPFPFPSRTSRATRSRPFSSGARRR